jgi:hypothetical protein
MQQIRTLKPEQAAQAAQLWNDGLTPGDIARKLGDATISDRDVRALLRKMDLERPTKPAPSSERRALAVIPEGLPRPSKQALEDHVKPNPYPFPITLTVHMRKGPGFTLDVAAASRPIYRDVAAFLSASPEVEWVEVHAVADSLRLEAEPDLGACWLDGCCEPKEKVREVLQARLTAAQG